MYEVLEGVIWCIVLWKIGSTCEFVCLPVKLAGLHPLIYERHLRIDHTKANKHTFHGTLRSIETQYIIAFHCFVSFSFADFHWPIKVRHIIHVTQLSILQLTLTVRATARKHIFYCFSLNSFRKRQNDCVITVPIELRAEECLRFPSSALWWCEMSKKLAYSCYYNISNSPDLPIVVWR